MRFPGVIMLREHFRCLPEIIDFSNKLCYNGAILPLREQPADPTHTTSRATSGTSCSSRWWSRRARDVASAP